ncbi:GroES-like protein [Clavulina sp. PMI_390]|nr:GroES-like protein [Clavulina sp. PMI_390]
MSGKTQATHIIVLTLHSATLNIQRALVVESNGKAKIITSKAYPTISPEEVIVNIKAVTLNPTDWKHLEGIRGALAPDTSLGSDFAGDIVEVGSEAESKGFKVGDAVAGFTRGGALDKDNGSFQEYIKMRAEHVWHKPATLSYEDAASMGGIALSTAVFSLLYRLGLPKPWEPKPEKAAPILIWAGSTSVGLFAIRLAKLCDPRIPVVTTASPHNFELVKARGADAVFDYKDPQVSKKIKEWAAENGYSEGIRLGLDCISEQGSTALVTEAMSGGLLNVLMVVSPVEGKSWSNNVEVKRIFVYDVLDPNNAQDFADIYEWNQHLPSLVTEKHFGNAIPLDLSNGLENIPSGLEKLRSGKVSGSKLAYIL